MMSDDIPTITSAILDRALGADGDDLYASVAIILGVSRKVAKCAVYKYLYTPHQDVLEDIITAIPAHCYWLIRKRVQQGGFNAYVSEPNRDTSTSGFTDPINYWWGSGDTPHEALTRALENYNSEHKEDT